MESQNKPKPKSTICKRTILAILGLSIATSLFRIGDEYVDAIRKTGEANPLTTFVKRETYNQKYRQLFGDGGIADRNNDGKVSLTEKMAIFERHNWIMDTGTAYVRPREPNLQELENAIEYR